MSFRSLLSVVLVGLASLFLSPAAADSPYESPQTVPATPLDDLIQRRLQEHGIQPAATCSDSVFVRRVHLDLLGIQPQPEEVTKFLNDANPRKRAALIDALLERDEFADYWSMKWCDALRVKAEFAINLWPNAAQAYHHWVRDALRRNMPYDQFAREMLTSSGSNFRVPPVNFYRAVQGRDASGIAAAVGVTFMGVRLDRWSEDRRDGMQAFFSRIKFKKTGEWKEEIVCHDPATTQALKAVLPNGKKLVLLPEEDPRQKFAGWLITKDNPYFAKACANRVWAWLFGRGIVHEPDDFRPDNPPANPELLDYLASEFAQSDFDLRRLYRLILNSQTYQQSSISTGAPSEADALFASYSVRRLDAEVLIDALCDITGTTEQYESPIPEPFTFLPADQRAVNIADGSITSQFLEMFGRPARDTGYFVERNNNPSDAQRLHLLNSSHVQRKIQNGPRLRALVAAARNDRSRMIRDLYLLILSRTPTEAESKIALAYFQTKGISQSQAVADIAWALINTKEFLYRH